MKRILLIAVAACLCAAPLYAQTCAAPVVQHAAVQQNYVAPVVSHVNEIAVSTYVPLLAVQVPVPSYSASYGPPQPAPLSPEAIELLRQMSARMDSMEAYLRGAQMTMPPAPAPVQPQPPLQPKAAPVPMMPNAPQASAGVSKYSACLACHSRDASKGGGHVLFANGLPNGWDCSRLLEVVDRISRDSSIPGVMPPNGNLSDEDAAAIVADCKLQARAVAKK